MTAAGFPVLTPGRHPADEPFAVADWRRRVAEIYADVRRVSVDDPSSAQAQWVQRRDVLLAEHPASPLDADAKAAFEGLDVPPTTPPTGSSARSGRPRPSGST